jgi:hypothetical protein
MFTLGLSEVIILVIVLSPVAVALTLWFRASRRTRPRRGPADQANRR